MKNSRECQKRFRTASKMTCSSSCRRWSKGSMTSCQSIRECRTDHKRCKASQDKRRNCREKVLQLKTRSGRSERTSIEQRNAFVCCRTKSITTKCLRQKWQQSFRDCRHESQTGDCCMEEAWQHFIALGANQIEALLQRYQREKEHFRRGSDEAKKEEGRWKKGQ